MDFELNINGQIETFTKYHEMEERLRSLISEWNNFYPETTLVFSMRKVKNDIPTLGAVVTDGINTADHFGRR